MNPELLRNLWLQFSLERTVAAPLIIGAVFALVAFVADGGWSEVGSAANIGFLVIVYLWGTRRAVNVLADEITSGTWDGQRMSSIGPWSMAWGKALGGTAYVWYCAAFCLLAYAAAEISVGQVADLPLDLALKISGALLVQVIALLFALVLVGKGRRLGRRSVAFAQGGALLIGLFGVSHGLLPSITDRFDVEGAGPVVWFGPTWPADDFLLLTQLLFLGWAAVGIYRLMAGELQVRQQPWMWLAFSVFLILYDQGFLEDAARDHRLRLAAALSIALPLFYVAVFAQSNDVVRYRWLFHHLRAGAWRSALSLLPLWLPGILLAAVLALALGLRAGDGLEEFGIDGLVSGFLFGEAWAGGPATAVALVLFMLRDLGLVLYLNFALRPRAPDLAAILYLIVLYVVLGGLVAAAGGASLLPVFFPGAGSSATFVVLAPLVQVVLVALLLWRRWASQARAMQPAPVAA
jgi:hypothetical protein